MHRTPSTDKCYSWLDAWCSLTDFHLWAHIPHAKRPRGRWLDTWCSLIDFPCKHTRRMPNTVEAALWKRLASHNTSHCLEHPHLLSPMALGFYTLYKINSNHTFYLHKQCFGRLVPLSSRVLLPESGKMGRQRKEKGPCETALFKDKNVIVFTALVISWFIGIKGGKGPRNNLS